MLNQFTTGKAPVSALDMLDELGRMIPRNVAVRPGPIRSNPLLTTMWRHFRTSSRPRTRQALQSGVW